MPTTPKRTDLHPGVRATLGRLRTGRALLHQAYRDLDHATGAAVTKADQVVERRQRDVDRLVEELHRQRHRGLHDLTDAQVMDLTRPGSGGGR